MIDIQVKIHDKFSVELKIGYLVGDRSKPEEFAVNMWIFVPNSLDINSNTYTNGQFYRDLKSNVRLITPVFLLREIAGGDALPYNNLEKSFTSLSRDPSDENIADFEYEIKMFMAILKSSARNEVDHIIAADNDIEGLCSRYTENLSSIISAYRSLRRIIYVPTVSASVYEYYKFGDDFMSSLTEKQTYRLINCLEKRGLADATITEKLKELIVSENTYRREQDYPVVDPESETNNRELVFRQGLLKRYIESDLFLSARKKRDGIAMEQFYFSLAAGMSMIFATAIAFSFQQRYGNFTMPLFVALVVSYMLKDRIKELMRFWFAHKLKDKYFDNRISISIKNDDIGWIKEGMDFITDDKVPPRVMEIRSRSPLLQAENRFADEKIILFRRLVQIDGEMLREEDRYTIAGINDIIRLHLNSFVQKMDNPKVPLFHIDKNGEVCETEGDKIYYLNLVLQLQSVGEPEYHRYRLVMDRQGLIGIERMR